MFRHYDRFKKIILKIDFFDYVNAKMLFQYDEKKILYFVVFYNRNIILTKCNYEIYNKELLTIIRYLKY